MWVESHEQPLQPYDAGTDSGPSFLSEDEPTSPFEPIFRFSEIMPKEDNIFYNPATCAAAFIAWQELTPIPTMPSNAPEASCSSKYHHITREVRAGARHCPWA